MRSHGKAQKDRRLAKKELAPPHLHAALLQVRGVRPGPEHCWRTLKQAVVQAVPDLKVPCVVCGNKGMSTWLPVGREMNQRKRPQHPGREQASAAAEEQSVQAVSDLRVPCVVCGNKGMSTWLQCPCGARSHTACLARAFLQASHAVCQAALGTECPPCIGFHWLVGALNNYLQGPTPPAWPSPAGV